MTNTFLPTALIALALKDEPIEKAIKPKAIVDTHLIWSTKL